MWASQELAWFSWPCLGKLDVRDWYLCCILLCCILVNHRNVISSVLVFTRSGQPANYAKIKHERWTDSLFGRGCKWPWRPHFNSTMLHADIIGNISNSMCSRSAWAICYLWTGKCIRNPILVKYVQSAKEVNLHTPTLLVDKWLIVNCCAQMCPWSCCHFYISIHVFVSCHSGARIVHASRIPPPPMRS